MNFEEKNIEVIGALRSPHPDLIGQMKPQQNHRADLKTQSYKITVTIESKGELVAVAARLATGEEIICAANEVANDAAGEVERLWKKAVADRH
jgi:hypothetical protein